jgi:hypothetical protein
MGLAPPLKMWNYKFLVFLKIKLKIGGVVGEPRFPTKIKLKIIV